MVFHQYLSRFLDSLEPNEAKNYRLRFEVFQNYLLEPHKYWLSRTRCCNSAYRLRYATLISRLKYCLDSPPVATVLTACGMRPRGWLVCYFWKERNCCNSAYRLRYATQYQYRYNAILHGCNSAYRLRYATKGARKQRSDDEVRTSLVPDRREGKTIKME